MKEIYIISGKVFDNEKRAKKYVCDSGHDHDVIVLNGSIIEEKASVIWDI